MFHPRGNVLFGLAGGMLLIASGFVAGYFVLGSKSEAQAATTVVEPRSAPKSGTVTGALASFPTRVIDIKTTTQVVKLKWADLGVEVDPGEVRAPAGSDSELTALAGKAAIPVKLDRDKAIKALVELKSKYDRSPLNAYLDLEARKIHDDVPGLGLDVWASLPRIEAAARQGAKTVELVSVPVPAEVTKATLGIDDISVVMGHYITRFPVSDRDRNFNLKLAASKVNGHVIKPGEEWSFNATVGERSEKEGYKIAHVITAGEMVDGLAGGTCQISTTLFGAAFFAGLDIVKTTNHSRPSAYTPLGFDATVVWPNTDLKLKNPYDFPVVLHYRVANGEAVVEILGKPRPYDKIVFERHVLESTPFTSEERLDDEMADGETSLDQEGFNGYTLERFRRFYKDKKLVKTNKWTVIYKPVTEYVRRGTNKDPDAKKPVQKETHSPHVPDNDWFSMSQ
jgi:vancomycin resistance protein YoaR